LNENPNPTRICHSAPAGRIEPILFYNLKVYGVLNRDSADPFGIIFDGVPAWFAELIRFSQVCNNTEAVSGGDLEITVSGWRHHTFSHRSQVIHFISVFIHYIQILAHWRLKRVCHLQKVWSFLPVLYTVNVIVTESLSLITGLIRMRPVSCLLTVSAGAMLSV
jgi:hypothetical protein